MNRIHRVTLFALLSCACGTSAPPDELPVLLGTGSAADSGSETLPDGGTSTCADGGAAILPDGGTAILPDGGTPPTPDGGTSPAPDGGPTEPPDSGPGTRADAGNPSSPDSGIPPTHDAGPNGTPDSGNPGHPDSGTGPTHDGGPSFEACTTTADCDFNQTCTGGSCDPATTCSNDTSACPPGTTMQTIPFEQCQPCPSGTVQIAMMDNPDAGFVCDGGVGNACVFTRCLLNCASQADCPNGLYCIEVSANHQECVPLSGDGSASLATLQCISGEANPGVPCLDTAECAYDQVCSSGTCVSSPSCGTDTNACPRGTADEAVYLHQCTACPPGAVTVSNPNDVDGGVTCPSGFFNICVADRCLIECTTSRDCPTGLSCIPEADGTKVCFPIYPGVVPTQAAAQCVGGE